MQSPLRPGRRGGTPPLPSGLQPTVRILLQAATTRTAGERSCHVHCALLDLSGMTVRAAPVPCLVGTARPHAVAIARGAAAPRLMIVAEVNHHTTILSLYLLWLLIIAEVPFDHLVT